MGGREGGKACDLELGEGKKSNSSPQFNFWGAGYENRYIFDIFKYLDKEAIPITASKKTVIPI